jgi:hypothetical protein
MFLTQNVACCTVSVPRRSMRECHQYIHQMWLSLMLHSRPLYKRYDIGTTVWSALASGILTGKVCWILSCARSYVAYRFVRHHQYNNGIPPDSRFAQHKDFFKNTLDSLTKEEGIKKIEKVTALTELAEKGKLAELSLHLRNPLC